MDKDSYGERFSSLDDLFLDIWDYCYADLEKSKDFDIMLYLNRTWKAQRLLRRLKKTLKSLKVIQGQLSRAFINLNLDVTVPEF